MRRAPRSDVRGTGARAAGDERWGPEQRPAHQERTGGARWARHVLFHPGFHASRHVRALVRLAPPNGVTANAGTFKTTLQGQTR